MSKINVTKRIFDCIEVAGKSAVHATTGDPEKAKLVIGSAFNEIHTLLTDVLDYVKPDYWQVFTPETLEKSQSWNKAREQMETKIKELGL
jgi:hypothetical protein